MMPIEHIGKELILSKHWTLLQDPNFTNIYLVIPAGEPIPHYDYNFIVMGNGHEWIRVYWQDLGRYKQIQDVSFVKDWLKEL
jgi:hypothetical protein